MDQRPYRLRSERLAQAVKLDRNEELMPGNEERVSVHVDVSGEIADTIESPWGLSSSPHFDTIHKQTTSSHPSFTVSSSHSVHSNLSSHASLSSLSVSLPSLSLVLVVVRNIFHCDRHLPTTFGNGIAHDQGRSWPKKGQGSRIWTPSYDKSDL